MENKTSALDLLRSGKAPHIQKKLTWGFSTRGISFRKRGVDKRLMVGAAISIEAYRLNKVLDRLYQDGDCVCATGANSSGYRCVFINKQNMTLHRFIYLFLVGPIDDKMVIDHKCRNRSCCNPNHLRAVTQQVNILCGNGATAKHAIKTHCAKGHEYTELNTYRSKYGRQCKVCRDLRNKNRPKSKRRTPEQLTRRRELYKKRQEEVIPKTKGVVDGERKE